MLGYLDNVICCIDTIGTSLGLLRAVAQELRGIFNYKCPSKLPRLLLHLRSI